MVEVLFYYHKDVRYGLNALVATMNSERDLNIHLIDDFGELLELATGLRNVGKKVVIALSLLTTMLADNSFRSALVEAISILKRKECVVVCGGPHPSGDPLGSLKSIGCDYVVIGEGEETLKELLTVLKDNMDPHGVKGVAFIENGKFVYTGRRKPINIDDYDPFPYWRGIIGPIEITRGCPYGCFYCQVSYVHGCFYRHRSVEKILHYARAFYECGGKDLRFITPNGFSYGSTSTSRTPQLERVEMLLESLKKLSDKYAGRVFLGTFPSELRPEHVTREALNILKKYVANRTIIMGAQSGSEKILKSIHRGHTVEDVINAVEEAVKTGFTPIVDIIVGFPNETVDDMLETVNLARTVARKGGRVHIHHYIPLPGTPFGLREPQLVPDFVKKELFRIIGLGKGYGDWIKQERLAWRIIELYKDGFVYPRSKAPGLVS